ncbi:MAG TPA: hypothetical protein V6C85_19220 [Allocoleopsis sp.]
MHYSSLFQQTFSHWGLMNNLNGTGFTAIPSPIASDCTAIEVNED